MVKGLGRLCSALCVLILLSPLGMSENPTADDAPQIIIDQNHGLFVEYNLNISGTYIDENLPTSLTWKIFNGLDLIDGGYLIDSLAETGDSHQSSRNSWRYSLDLNFSSYAPCSCLLEIWATDANNQIDVAQLILFAQGEEWSQLNPSITFDVGSQLPNKIIFSGNHHIMRAIAMDDEGLTGAQWAISNSSAIAMSCTQSWIESPESVHWYNTSMLFSEPDSAGWLFYSRNYEDGEYSLIVRAVSDDGLTSPCACMTFGIDNHAPTARIEGPTEVNETAVAVQFDGSGSSDQYWGREGLVFLWVLEGGPDGLIIESGDDYRTFEVDASQSGNYTLTLTVADDAGFSDTTTHQFNITNQAPVARLSVGGQHLEDGDRITLIDEEQWPIECGDSTDSENDMSGLVCTWYIDGVPLMTGWERQMQQPDDLDYSHTLMLEVTDDNGATDTITVTFGVQGTPSDPKYSDELEEGGFWELMIIIAGILVSIYLVIILIRFYFYGEHSSTIPKWKRD